MDSLIRKYNVAVPRYTSYPTVPNWKTSEFDQHEYITHFKEGLKAANHEGISLYIHLPYCESLCTYCGCNTRLTVNHQVEGPYIDALLKEWLIYRSMFETKPRIAEIHLGGGTPTFFSVAQLKRLVNGLLENSEVAEDASFSFEAHPANTTDEHLTELKTLGFDRLSLGVQDFDPKVQAAINRKQTPEDVARVTTKARALGYRSVNFDLVYGLPFQTLDGVLNAVDEVINLKPDRIAFYSYAHVPWKRPGQRAYDESDLPKGKAKLDLFIQGRKKLMEAGYHAIGFDHFALDSDSLYKSYESGTMHRNFMGYTDRKTEYLIGLGASSISDIGSAFAQNAKSVEGYLKKVNESTLPLVKGHLLTVDEKMIRQHILNLTCKHRTSWAFGSKGEREYMRDRLSKLRDADSDQLVEYGMDWIRLTEKGRYFVRNICSAFDKDYDGSMVSRSYSMGI